MDTAAQKPVMWLLVHAAEVAEGALRKTFIGTPLQAVTRAQTSLFRALGPVGSATVGDLARELGVTSQAIGESIRRSQRDGLVEVTRAPDDSRVRMVTLSPLGRDLLRAVCKEMDRIESRISAMLGSDRLDQLREDLVVVAMLEEPAQTARTPSGKIGV